MVEREGWLHVRVHVRPLGWTGTAAAGSLPTQPHASPPFTRPFSSELVQGLIAMLSTMVPAFSLARLMTMPSFSAPQPKGNASFPLYLFILLGSQIDLVFSASLKECNNYEWISDTG